MRIQQGFTLIELMVVVAIIAILAAIGVPSFQTFILDNRLTSTTNSLLGAMQLARSEAVTQRSTIKVCAANATNTNCTAGTDWKAGIVIMRGTTLLKVVQLNTSGVSVTSSLATIQYKGDGTTTAASITVNDSRGNTSRRTVKINAIGQSCSGSSCS